MHSISREEMEAKRSRSALANWTDEVIQHFGSSAIGRVQFRLNAGSNIKQFKEEMMPLRRFADYEYADKDDYCFQLVLGNQSYDARVVGPTGEVIQYVQITQAVDGYQNALRMLHLNLYGTTPVTGGPLKKDKAGTIAKAESQFERREEIMAREHSLIRDAVYRKSKMRYEENTVLVVQHGSTVIIDDEYKESLNQYVKAEVLPLVTSFVCLVLVASEPGFELRYEIK